LFEGGRKPQLTGHSKWISDTSWGMVHRVYAQKWVGAEALALLGVHSPQMWERARNTVGSSGPSPNPSRKLFAI
jgi:hypothetical protein